MKLRVVDIVLGSVILVYIIVGGLLLYGTYDRLVEQEPEETNTQTLSFSLSDYSDAVEEHPCDKNIGEVSDRETAVQSAKELWAEQYTIQNNDPTNGWEPKVSYDADSSCWFVTLNLPKSVKEATVPCALIQKDGTVLSVWLEREAVPWTSGQLCAYGAAILLGYAYAQ